MGGSSSKAASEAVNVTRKYPAPSVVSPPAAPAPAATAGAGVPRPSAIPTPSRAPEPTVEAKIEESDTLTPEEEAAVERDVRDRRVANTLAGIKFENVGKPVEIGFNVKKDNEMIDVIQARLARTRRPGLKNPYITGSNPSSPQPEPPRTRLLIAEVEDLIGLSTRRRIARKEWTVEKVAEKFKVAPKEAEALLKYFNVPTVEQGSEQGKLDGYWTEPDEKGRIVRPKA